MYDEETTYRTPKPEKVGRRMSTSVDLLYNIQLQIRAADQKIGVLFGANTLIAAALTVTTQYGTRALSDLVPNPIHIAGLVMLVLLFVFVALGMVSGILALMPRAKITTAEWSSFYFGHVTGSKHDEFIRDFIELSDEQLLTQVLSQVHVNSIIAAEKFKWTRRAASALLTSVLLLMVEQVLIVVG